jgi:long-chain acyl-CoA synthetase
VPAGRPHLATLVEDFEANGDQTAFVTPVGLRQRRISYSELATLSHRFAAELISRDIRKGDRVLIWAENSAEWVAAFFGCVLRGVLPVPLDSASSLDFARRVFADTGPRLLIADRDKSNALSSSVQRLVPADLPSILTSQTAGVALDLRDSDPLQIIFTSGTTSEPKGIVHTHANVLASLRPIESEMQKYLRYERPFHPLRFLHTLPLSHVFGQFMGLWIPPLLAAEVHFDSDLVAARLLERIKTERISVLACVPRVLDLLQQHVTAEFPGLSERVERAERISAVARWWRFRKIHRQFGLKFWAFVCGGASLPPALEQFWSRLGFLVVQGYGMTETTALVSLNHPFRAAKGTIGQVLPGREVRLNDDGELLVRGDTISNATWQDGAIRAAPGEWLATGDLAEFDEHGNLRFRGRKKETIVTAAGLNIYPQDLESALLRSAGVRAAAILEIQNAPYAVLLMHPGADPSAAVANANDKLAAFQQIRRWTVWPEADFPRTSTGKVSNRQILARLQQPGAAAVSSEELNLDSLGRVELQARIEQQYGITLDDQVLQQVKTPADLQQLIAAPPAAVASARHWFLHWPWNPFVQLLRAGFIRLIAIPLVRLLTHARVRNRVAGDFGRTPLFIVANHITSYDVPFILLALPPRLRTHVAVAMSGEMLLDYRYARNQGNWFLNLLAPAAYLLITALFNVFPLPRDSAFRRSFRHAGEALDRGYSVLVFPEGRRSDDGKPQPFRTGAGLLWRDLGTPALAVRIEGLGDIKASGGRWFRQGNIVVSVRELLAPPPHASPEQLTRLLEAAVFGQAVSDAGAGPCKLTDQPPEQGNSEYTNAEQTAE